MDNDDDPIDWFKSWLHEAGKVVANNPKGNPIQGGAADFIPVIGDFLQAETRKKRVATALPQLSGRLPSQRPTASTNPGGGFRVDVKLDASRITDLRPPDGSRVTFKAKIKPLGAATVRRGRTQKLTRNRKPASQGY